MIFKCLTFFTRLGIAVSIGLIVFVLVILSMVDATKSYIESSQSPNNNMSYIVESHQITEQEGIGTVHMCSICGKYFTKTSDKINCCSAEHEKQYQELYKAWMTGKAEKEIIEASGKKFK